MSGRQAAWRFGVSAASASRWRHLERANGDAQPRVQCSDRQSGQTEAHAARILTLYEAKPDHLDRGVTSGFGRDGRRGRLWRVVAVLQTPSHHREKKTAHAAEQACPDVLKRREDWFDGQIDLDPSRLVFFDETWASTNMARRDGRAPKGPEASSRHTARALENDDLRRQSWPGRHHRTLLPLGAGSGCSGPGASGYSAAIRALDLLTSINCLACFRLAGCSLR